MTERLTRYETARLLGARALQLAQGATPAAKPGPGQHASDVAEAERAAGLVPIRVVR